jgi:hypothetical protein
MINSQRKGEKSRKPIGERYQEISERWKAEWWKQKKEDATKEKNVDSPH